MGASWHPGRSQTGSEKKVWLRDHARGKFGVFNGLGYKFGSVAAILLGFGVLGSDIVILATFGLAPRRLPATNMPEAVRILAVALVPVPCLVPTTAPFTQAFSDARSALWPNGDDFSYCGKRPREVLLPRESSGRVREHSLRAPSKH